MRPAFDLSVYCIIDPEACAGRDIGYITRAALDGGATLLQYRDKRGDRAAAYDGAKIVQDSVRNHRRSVPLLINDYPDIAADIHADGVHVGQGDLDVVAVRSLIGPDAILGLTAFTADHMAAIDPAIVDYVGTGPVYPTKTDKGKPILGVEGLASLVALSPVPVVAIGGLTADNITGVMESGVDGIAVMRAITAADDPRQATEELNKAVKI